MIGLTYHDTDYFYIRDITGNIVKIIDEFGATVVKYSYNAWGKVTKTDVANNCISGIICTYNPHLYKGYYYDSEIELYYCNTRYYSPELCRWISADAIYYINPSVLENSNLYVYCSNNPVMRYDPEGKFAISLAILGLIIGAIIGAIVGGTVSYEIAKDKEQTGWSLIGWTVLGAIAGAVIGGAIGYGIGSLTTAITGIAGLSITKYGVLAIKSVTILGNMPGYIGAAEATGSGYYLISSELYEKISETERWANNSQYLKDAYDLGTQFVVAPDYVVRSGGTLWEEIQYLIEHGIPWTLE